MAAIGAPYKDYNDGGTDYFLVGANYMFTRNNSGEWEESGTTLTAEETDATYQWIDCNTSQIIPGETDKSCTFSSEGSYAVEISINGCIDTSFCRVINVLGLTENDFGRDISVYPNPTDHYININLGKVYNDLDVQVVNVTGNIVMNRHFDRQKDILLNLDDLPKGLYFIKLKTNKKNAFIRVVKNR